MKDYNPNISDHEIQYLLKCRLIEEVEDDSFTQKQLDMETDFILNSEAIILPSIEKEKAFIEKLTQARRTNFGSWKWFIPIMIITVLSFYFIYSNKNNNDKNPVSLSIPAVQEIKRDSVAHSMPNIKLSTENKTAEQIQSPVLIVQQKDGISKIKKEKWVLGDAGVRGSYQIGERNPSEAIDNYDNPIIPILNKEQIKQNNNRKERMVKQLMKAQRSRVNKPIKHIQPEWVYIPMSTDTFNGEIISVNSFYISTKEVTNWEYHVFLNDLLIQGKTDEYVNAVPDTTKWRIDNNLIFEPMINNYFWHPTYGNFPVVNISREAAQMYCNWLTKAVNDKNVETYKMTSYTTLNNPIPNSVYMNDLRLPTDVEWIIAAKAGNSRAAYPWPILKYAFIEDLNSVQNTKGCYLCNFSNLRNAENLKQECSKKDKDKLLGVSARVEPNYTSDVGSYFPNDFGICNMSGNVAEMVWNYKTKKPGTKGGSWNSDAEHVKINAEDEYAGIIEASPFIGFRPVFTTTPLKK